MQKKSVALSIQTIKRMPLYYNQIKELKEQGVKNISAPMVAKRMGLHEVLVRKDLAAVSEIAGRPKMGFDTEELLKSVSKFLGYNNQNDAIIVGVGNMGMALLSYDGFEEFGLHIVAGFDTDESKLGETSFGKNIFPMDRLNDLCRRLNLKIGILCVPAADAQDVCNLLIDSGIMAIWNFTPINLSVPSHIIVQQENLAISLSNISRHLLETQRMLNDKN
jgi:redox-sensing transcriptional repressor